MERGRQRRRRNEEVGKEDVTDVVVGKGETNYEKREELTRDNQVCDSRRGLSTRNVNKKGKGRGCFSGIVAVTYSFSLL